MSKQTVVIHEAAAAEPPMSSAAQALFDAQLKRYGAEYFPKPIAVRVPEANGRVNGTLGIVAHKNTWEACQRMRLDCKIELYEGDQSPTELAAIAMLLQNPQLSDGQRLAITVDCVAVASKEAKSRQKAAGGTQKRAFAQLSKSAPPGPADGNSDSAGSASPGEAGEDEADTDPVAVHTRRVLSELSGISPATIGRGIQLKRCAPHLFEQLRTRQILNVTSALNHWKREQRARQASGDNGPLAKPFKKRARSDCELIVGDCLKVLVDPGLSRPRVIFADPPYNNGWHYDADPTGDRRSDDDYLDWDQRWMRLCANRLADNGSMFVLIDDRYSDHFGIRMRRTGLHRRNTIVWWEHFPNHQTGNYTRAARYIHYYTKHPKNFIWHPPMVLSTRGLIDDKRVRDKPDGKWKVPDNVWPINRVCGNFSARVPFEDAPPAVPVELALRCILAASEPGDLVMDPFNGNGTSGIAALLSGRQYVGIDRSKKYIEQSRGWIDDNVRRGRGGAPAKIQEVLSAPLAAG